MIHLVNINSKNVWDIVALKVKETQQKYVATNTESIIEAYTTISAGGVAFPFGIYADEIPIGFLMIGYGDVPGEDTPGIAKNNYCIWRFMIDAEYQGKGYAKEALTLALEYIKKLPAGNAEYCYLSYEPENAVAARLYHSFGFRETGEYDGEEIIASVVIA